MVLLSPFQNKKPLLVAVKRASIKSFNAIVIFILLTKEYEAFSNVSIFGVHTENGSFSKRIVMRFCEGFQKLRFHSGAL